MRAAEARALKPGDWVLSNYKHPCSVISNERFPRIALHAWHSSLGKIEIERNYQSLTKTEWKFHDDAPIDEFKGWFSPKRTTS